MSGARTRLFVVFLLLFSFMATNICTGDAAVVVVEDTHHDEEDAFLAGFLAGCITGLLLSKQEEVEPLPPRRTATVVKTPALPGVREK